MIWHYSNPFFEIRTTLATNKAWFRRHERMDPATEIRVGPVVPKILLSHRQFVQDAGMRESLEKYSGIKRSHSHAGSWKEVLKTMTITKFGAFRNLLKSSGDHLRVLSTFLAVFNEVGKYLLVGLLFFSIQL